MQAHVSAAKPSRRCKTCVSRLRDGARAGYHKRAHVSVAKASRKRKTSAQGGCANEGLRRRLRRRGLALRGRARAARQRRGVGVRPRAGARRGDQRARPAPDGSGGARADENPATTDGAALPPCDFGLVATKAMHTGAAIAAAAHAFREARRLRPERHRQRRDDRSARRARDPRHDVPGGEAPRARRRAVGRARRHDARPLRASPAPAAEIERLADACTRGGMPTAAVADARGAQWRKVIFNAATNPIGALTGLTHGRVCERRRYGVS